jgi:hypothetical protein
MRQKRNYWIISIFSVLLVWSGFSVSANFENSEKDLSNSILKALDFFPKDIMLAD